MSPSGQLDLSISDLSIAHSVCEIRYDMAFLIFDRTGAVCLDCKEQYPDLKLIQASPSSTSFSQDQCTFWLEQTQSRVALARSRHDPKEFGEHAKPFFEIVLRQMEINVLTRLGLRQIYFKTFKEPDGAVDFVKGLKLQHQAGEEEFGISGPTNEVVFRWETAQRGTMLHVVAIPGSAAIPTVDVRQIEEGFDKIYKSILIFDVDYYTNASIQRSQWDSQEWISNSSHSIKKGLRSFLSKCQ